ncbi:UNVERIFIED_CONTAM: hypothetical protein Sangu_0466600 [Sesamum angustifolium]|uniref:Uncharacterized protein n=1 Tax=Sesamum angustifolium TaxID=2727405 RepID=A0AAW2QUU3_9LAMI
MGYDWVTMLGCCFGRMNFIEVGWSNCGLGFETWAGAAAQWTELSLGCDCCKNGLRLLLGHITGCQAPGPLRLWVGLHNWAF